MRRRPRFVGEVRLPRPDDPRQARLPLVPALFYPDPPVTVAPAAPAVASDASAFVALAESKLASAAPAGDGP